MSHERPASVPAVLLDTIDLANRLRTRPDGEGPSPRTIERWRMTGQGPAFIKIGHRVLYRESAIEQWLDEQTRTHTNQLREPITLRRRAR